jgi:hypothetical protein
MNRSSLGNTGASGPDQGKPNDLKRSQTSNQGRAQTLPCTVQLNRTKPVSPMNLVLHAGRFVTHLLEQAPFDLLFEVGIHTGKDIPE